MSELARLTSDAERAIRNVHDALVELRTGADVAASVVILRATAESKLMALRTGLGRRWLSADHERMRALLVDTLDARFIPFSLGALTLEEIARLESALAVAALLFADVSDTERRGEMAAVGGE